MTRNDDDLTRDLIESASSGDEPAIAQLLEEFLPDLQLYVRRHAGRLAIARESSADLVQSICRELLERLGDGRFTYRGVGQFRKWLYRAALMKISARRSYHGAERRDPARERSPQPTSAVVPADTATDRTPSSIAALHEELDRLQDVLEELPERYAQVIELAQVEGLSHAEIAERLGISENNSRVLLARARARLASVLHRDGTRPGASGQDG